VLHGFRYIGFAVLIPRVVSPQLSATVFARGLAYGDLVAATLALIALAALRTKLAAPLVWIFNIFGTSDLLNAFYQGNRLSLADTPGLLGAGYFIPIFGVPLLLVTHILVFRVLMRKERELSVNKKRRMCSHNFRLRRHSGGTSFRLLR
jgi:hypothetical protein